MEAGRTAELPWAAIGAPSTGQDPLVMGSRFELASAWRSPGFFAYAMRIWRQVRRSPGIVGVSLRAYPLRGTFWTLSAWTDEAALQAFARTHWTVPADKLVPVQFCAEAGARITAPAD